MRNKTTTLIVSSLIFLSSIFITSCIFFPKTVPDEENRECLLVTKSLAIDYYTGSDMIDEAVDEMVNAIASDCHEPECLILLAPLITVSAGSLIVSGSIVAAGNTIHWIEEQGKCDDSATRQTLNSLITSTKELGGHVINTGNELIEWFKKQASYEGQLKKWNPPLCLSFNRNIIMATVINGAVRHNNVFSAMVSDHWTMVTSICIMADKRFDI